MRHTIIGSVTIGREGVRTWLSVLCAVALAACQTASVEPLRYTRSTEHGHDIHVTRIDLDQTSLRVVVSGPSSRGQTVSEAALENSAVVAVNGDYFNEDKSPVGLSVGGCKRWESTGSQRRQWVVAFGRGRAEILQPESLDEKLPGWATDAVSGWPRLIRNCRAFSAEELPGSDGFTRSPHPRTAIGLDASGRYLYLLVADGRREGVPGLELAELAGFMSEELGVCSAINLDGGGSSAMFFRGEITNVPSDGQERPVANHVLVVENDSISSACD